MDKRRETEKEMAGIQFRTATIFHTEEDTAWCKYILKQFQVEKLNLKVETLNVSSLSMKPPPEMEMALRESYVIILLTTSYFMDYMEENADWLPKVLHQRDHKVTTIISALLHVDDKEFQNVTTTKDYDQSNWEAVEIDVSGKNMKACISLILGNADQNSAKMTTQKSLAQKGATASTEPSPKQVTRVEMIPSVVQGAGERIALIFPSEITGAITVQFKGMKNTVTAEALNPYCYVFTTPELTSERTYLQIKKDNEKYSQTLRLTKKMPVPEFSGLDLMCQSYGVTSKDELDKKLADKFNSSLCTDGQANSVFDELMDTTSTSSASRPGTLYPTILHWAAANGLKDISSALLSAPGANLACGIANSEGKDPADLAENNGHHELASLIFDFMETREMAVACEDYVKFISKQQQQNPSDDDGSDDPYEDVANLPMPPPLPPRDKSKSAEDASDDNDYASPKPYPPPDQFFKSPIEPVMTPGAIGSRSQKELIDIQQAVKKGCFTVKEAVMLFSAWKNRYETGNAISFRDRQQSLLTLREQHKNAVKVLKTGAKKSKKKKKGKVQAEESDTFGELEVSEPFQSRRPFGALPSPKPGGSGRESNTSQISVDSWRSSHDSGRDSSVSQHSNLSEDGEVQDGRRSTKELYLQLMDDDLPPGSPPPLPPRPRQTETLLSPSQTSPGISLKSLVFSKKDAPPPVAKKPSFKSPK